VAFEVHSNDGVHTISCGVHERFTVQRAAFEGKVSAKTGSQALADQASQATADSSRAYASTAIESFIASPAAC